MPPRAITATVRRRSWLEPRVRTWLVVGAIVAAAAVVFAGGQISDALRDRWLIDHGLRVMAHIDRVNGVDRPAYKGAPEDHYPVEMSFPLPGQGSQTVKGLLEGIDYTVNPGMQIPLRVDPADPQRWTARVEAVSMLRDLLVAFLLVPVVLACVAAGLAGRGQVMHLWKHGEARLATVVGVGHSALAPRSRSVRCALRTGRDSRVFTVHLPMRVGRALAGQEIWVIVPAGTGGRFRKAPSAALAALAFQS